MLQPAPRPKGIAMCKRENAKECVSRLLKYAAQGRVSDALDTVRIYDAVSAEPDFHAFLCGLYPDDCNLQLGADVAYKYACSIREPQNPVDLPLARGQPDPVLVRPLVKPPKERHIRLAGYPQLMSCFGRVDGGRHTYAMTNFDPHEFKLACYDSSYEAGLASSEALRFELVHAWRNYAAQLQEHDAPLDYLPLRAEIHALTKGFPIRSGVGRAALIGVSTLTCYKHGDKYEFVIGKRRADLAVERDKWHVIPSGMFESPKPSDPVFYSIYETVLREYVEEFYSPDEKLALKKHGAEWYRIAPEGTYLEELLEDRKKAELFVTGVSVSLDNLRPDVTTLLLIHNPSWRERYYENMIIESEFVSRKEITLPEDESDLTNYVELKPENSVTVGAAAVVLGTRLARKILTERSKTKPSNKGSSESSESDDPESLPNKKAMLYRKKRTPSGKAYERLITLAAASAITQRIIKKGTWDESTKAFIEDSTSYDLIIDELADDTCGVVYTRQDNGGIVTKEIKKSDGMGWLMLWLVLSSTGGEVTEADISGIRSKSTAKTGFRIYPKKLAKVVGADTNKRLAFFDSPLPLAVPATGFSFYWICRSAKPEESRLLHPLR